MGKYSFYYFVNQWHNRDNYINTDTIQDLFRDGTTYTLDCDYRKGLLNNITKEITPGLLGSKDIVVYHASTSNHTFYVHGNIDEYEGKFCFLPEIKNIIFGRNARNGIISKSRFKYTIINDNEKMLECKQDTFGKDIDTIQVQNTTYSKSGNADMFYSMFDNNDNKSFVDYRESVNKINRYNIFNIFWNLSNYIDENGNSINKFEECFNDGTIYKPNGSNTIGLLNNIPIDLLNNVINVNLCGDKPITLYTNKDNSKIRLLGDNTKYTGVIHLSPKITEIYFQGKSSKVKINIPSNRFTTVLDNKLTVLESQNDKVKLYYTDCKLSYIPDNAKIELIDETTDIKLSDVIICDIKNDERDSINNIQKYNKSSITWNTNNIEDCFIDGSGLLSNLQLSTINANLIGNKNIVINTTDNVINLLGDNSLYNGKITVPSNVNEIHLNKNFDTNDIIYNGSNNISYVYIDQDNIEDEQQKNTDDNANSGETNPSNTTIAKNITIDLTKIDWINNIILESDNSNQQNSKLIINGNNGCFSNITLNTPQMNNITLSYYNNTSTINIKGINFKYTNNSQ
ncbi:MAG: hypothetical protein IJ848_03070 [Alphaproteobacteria bacterium]|nr:hypothetical protein [Alphaproteobacteria bacterium]